MPVNSLKSRLRDAAAAKRAAAFAAIPGAGEAIARHFLENLPWDKALVISGYLPMKDEADVAPLLRQLAERGRGLALPVVTNRAAPLEFRAWMPGDPLEDGVFGTCHPLSGPVVDPDLLLVPLLAFDESGYRLGYGGGYYDRSLTALRRRRPILAVGIGYAAQLFPPLPHDPHDQRLDWMVTEQGVTEFRI